MFMQYDLFLGMTVLSLNGLIPLTLLTHLFQTVPWGRVQAVPQNQESVHVLGHGQQTVPPTGQQHQERELYPVKIKHTQ